MSSVFVAPYFNKYLFYCRGIYWSTENLVLYTLTLFIFFQILIFWLFSAYYYMMSLSDFRPIFLYEFKLSQALPK